MSDAPLKECPECGEEALEKLVSAAPFRLKGGGWYETDFKSGKKKNVHDSDEGSKADAKPADKAAAKPAEKSASGSTTATKKSTASKN